LVEDGAVSWDEVLARWRQRGPMNAQYVENLQRGRRALDRLLADA
jgi:hypothetical protein